MTSNFDLYFSVYLYFHYYDIILYFSFIDGIFYFVKVIDFVEHDNH